MSGRVRSKREAEYLAHVEEQEREIARRDKRRIEALASTEPGEGYINIGPLAIGSVNVHDYCLRCGANVIGRERHDAWHRLIEPNGEAQ